MKNFMFISDIHSNIIALEKIKQLAEYSDTTRVYLGDYIDGFNQEKNSGIEVMEFIKEDVEKNGAVALIGNHDKIFVDAANGSYYAYQHWGKTGRVESMGSWGLSGMDDLKKEPVKSLVDFIGKLPTSMQLTKKIRIAHAGIRWKYPFKEQDDSSLLWIREEYFDHTNKKHPSNLGYVYVTGHTPNQLINHDYSHKIIKREVEGDTTLYLIDGGSKSSVMVTETGINVLILDENGEFINSYYLTDRY